MLMHSFSQIYIIGDFILNQDFIAKNLCENIDKPVLKCNGKCHLKKELEKDEERKSDERTSKVEVLLFCDCTPIYTEFEMCFEVAENEYSTYSNTTLNGYLSDVFHPPC